MTIDVTTLALAVDSRQVNSATAALDQFAAKGTKVQGVADAMTKAFAELKTEAAATSAGIQRLVELAEAEAAAAGKRTTGAKGLGAAQQAQGKAAALAAMQTQQLSNQIQDFIVQVQAGGNPLTAFIQQGSQLSAVYGGFGNAFRAVTGLFTVGRVAIGGAAGAFAALALAVSQAKDEQNAYAIAIASTNNAAGVSKGRLSDMAREVSGTVGTVGAAADALAQLTASGRIAGQDLPRFATIAIQSQRLLGREVSDTVKAFAELGRDPVQASIRLNEQTHYLTASVLEQIMALEAQGKHAAAVSLAQNAQADAQNLALVAAEKNLGTVQRAWLAVGDEAKKAWDKMLDLVRPQSLQQQLDAVNAALSQPRRGFNPLRRRSEQDLQDQRDAIQESQRLQARASSDAALQVQAENDKLDELSNARQAARAGVRRAQDALDLAQLLNSLAEQRSARTVAFQRDEIDAKGFHDELLRIDTDTIQAQIDNINKLRATEAARKPADQNDRLAQSAALVQYDAQRVQLQKQLIDLQEQEALGQRDVAPKARFDPADTLRAFKALDESNVEKFLADQRIAEGQLAVETANYTRALLAEIDARARQQQLVINGIGLSDRERESAARLAQSEEKYQDELRKLNDDRATGKLTKTEYDRRLQALDQYHAKAIDSEKTYQDQLTTVQGNATLGAQRAIKNYVDATRDAASTTERAFTNVFQSLEDSLVDFVRTGKLNFRSLADSIISEIIRVQVRASLAKFSSSDTGKSLLALFGLGGSSPGSFDVSGGGDVGFGGLGFADGGRPPVGRASLVGERGPELFVPDQPGTVIPNGAAGGDTYQVIVQGDATANTLRLIDARLAQFAAKQQRKR